MEILYSKSRLNAVRCIQTYYRNHLSSKIPIPNYCKHQTIESVCKESEGKNIEILAKFGDREYKIKNCNIIGDMLESICFQKLKESIGNIEYGPKQCSPDFWVENREYEYEHKCFTIHPGFDIANFESYIDQLCKPYGVYRKIFRTKYLVFEYIMNEENIKITKFHSLSVWNIVGYNGKYPISLQAKRGMWYNIRPSCTKEWNNTNKSPDMFMKNIIECIKHCPNNIQDRDGKIKNILYQYRQLKMKYYF